MNKLSSWKKEFPFHITKRSDVCWWKSLLARFGAVLFGTVLLCLLLLIYNYFYIYPVKNVYRIYMILNYALCAEIHNY